MLFPVAIFQKNGKFVANIPDLPNLEVSGDTIVNTISLVRSEIIAYLQTLSNEGEPIVVGRDIGTYLADEQFFGAIWAIVNLDSLIFSQATLSYPLVLPKSLLSAIYQATGTNDNENVQEFILSAIETKLANSSPKLQAQYNVH